MITLNFYKDGAYIKGHDINEICTLVSYAMWNCIEDCLDINDDVWHYESGYDEKWKYLGFTYIKINLDCVEHIKILDRFRSRIIYWVGGLFPNRVKINENQEELINWNKALFDAKQEQNML
jgi:hypothetical protein